MNAFRWIALSLALGAGLAQAGNFGPSNASPPAQGNPSSSPAAGDGKFGPAPANPATQTNPSSPGVNGTSSAPVSGTTPPAVNGTATVVTPNLATGSRSLPQTPTGGLTVIAPLNAPASGVPVTTPEPVLPPAASTSVRSFDQIDHNGDARLSAAELGLESSQLEFKQRDANHDGYLSQLEFNAPLDTSVVR